MGEHKYPHYDMSQLAQEARDRDEKTATARSHQGLPVHGYQPQRADKVEKVNEHKVLEERLLRVLDVMRPPRGLTPASGEDTYDQRWLAIARSHFEEGFMALNRAVFKPGRVSLPEDKE